jgi:hypothetical protein
MNEAARSPKSRDMGEGPDPGAGRLLRMVRRGQFDWV